MVYLDTVASSESYSLSSDGAVSEWCVCTFSGYLYLPSSLSSLFPSAAPFAARRGPRILSARKMYVFMSVSSFTHSSDKLSRQEPGQGFGMHLTAFPLLEQLGGGATA